MEYKQFEIFGYFDEFYCDNRFIGTIRKSVPDGLIMGYKSMSEYILDADLVCDNGKKIKRGTKVKTYQFPLCGKYIGGKWK